MPCNDILEGVLHYSTKEMLKNQIFEKKHFSLEELNRRISSFDLDTMMIPTNWQPFSEIAYVQMTMASNNMVIEGFYIMTLFGLGLHFVVSFAIHLQVSIFHLFFIYSFFASS